MITDPP